MRSHIGLGRVCGIRVGLHYSWFLIALLLVLSFSANFHQHYPNWGIGALGAWSVVTTVLFFVSLLLHELSHSVLARRYGLRVREITLFALGGVSQVEGELPSAGCEFRIAIAGPLTSAAIGAVCLAAIQLPGLALAAPAGTMLSWIGYINLSIAAFNMLPGYPMDGGRVLRSFLWWRSGNLERATRTAAATGTGLAIAFIVIGILDYFRGGGLGGLWIAFLGWFLLQASRENYLEVSLKEELRGVRVSDVMASDAASVDGHLTVQDFVDHELLRTGRRCFLVREHGKVVGMVTPHDVRRVDRGEWATTAVEVLMHPLDTMRSVEPESSLLEGIEAMARADLNQVPVMKNGSLVGLLSRAEVVAFLQTKTELERSGVRFAARPEREPFAGEEKRRDGRGPVAGYHPGALR